MKNMYLKITKFFMGLVILTNIVSVNTTCWWHLYQPELPEKLKNRSLAK